MTEYNLFLITTLLIIIEQIKCDQIIKEAPSNLIFVYSHFRHGSRSSNKLTKEGINLFNISQIGSSELNAIGARMHYLIGVRNSIRYKNFLSKNYDPREIYIQSSNTNRTILSATNQLAGLYQNQEINEQIIDRSIPPLLMNKASEEIDQFLSTIQNLGNYQNPGRMTLIPIHVVQSDYERINCTRKYEIKSLENHEKVISFVNSFSSKYSSDLVNLLGLEEGYFKKMKNIIKVCDQYITSLFSVDNSQINGILNKVGINGKDFENKCSDAMVIKNSYYDWGDENGTAVVVSISRLMRDKLNLMEVKIKDDMEGNTDFASYDYDDYSRPKMFFLSGHESSVCAVEVFLQKFLGLNDFYDAKFASNMFFELYRNTSRNNKDYGDYYVEYYFDDKLVKTWNFDFFRENVLKGIWTEEKIDQYCNNVSDKPVVKKAKKKAFEDVPVIFGLVFLIFTGIILFGLCFIFFLKLKNRRKGFYELPKI